jgi:tRNA(Ile)-lysidine synthase
MSLAEKVTVTIEENGLLLRGDTVVLGVSGGPDSLCMLHVLHQLAAPYGVALHVAHLHHGLRGQEADEDARFVADLCQAWSIPCTIGQADVPGLARARRLAIEEAARQARYAFLGSLARALGAQTVAVAHSADDQVETVLMHLLRGSGLAGLRGMRPLAWLDELRLGERSPQGNTTTRIRLARPLLGVSRPEIEAYCRQHGLRPRDDRSNLDQTYYRNRLRHELIPFLETYNPNVCEVLWRTAEVIAADYDLLRQQLLAVWPSVVQYESEDAIRFDLSVLRDLPLGLQRSVLREGIHRLRASLRNINWVHVDDALRIVRRGHAGAMATLPQGLVLSLGYSEATLATQGQELPLPEDRPRLCGGPLPVSVPGQLALPGSDWTMVTEITARDSLPGGWQANPDLFVAYLDASALSLPLLLRQRQEGDWLSPLGLGGRRQKLRDFMINAKIPRPERATVPLLACGGEIVWVVGWRVDARYAITPTTTWALIVRCQRLDVPEAGAGGES